MSNYYPLLWYVAAVTIIRGGPSPSSISAATSAGARHGAPRWCAAFGSGAQPRSALEHEAVQRARASDELQRAVTALGYGAPVEDIDALFVEWAPSNGLSFFKGFVFAAAMCRAMSNLSCFSIGCFSIRWI